VGNYPHLAIQGEDEASKEIREALFSQNENINLSWGLPTTESVEIADRPFFSAERFHVCSAVIAEITI
jgi:hypothetical protein